MTIPHLLSKANAIRLMLGILTVVNMVLITVTYGMVLAALLGLDERMLVALLGMTLLGLLCSHFWGNQKKPKPKKEKTPS